MSYFLKAVSRTPHATFWKCQENFGYTVIDTESLELRTREVFAYLVLKILITELNFLKMTGFPSSCSSSKEDV